MTCVEIPGGVICLPRDWVEFARRSDVIRWCFRCRARYQHDWVLEGESGITYYDPQWSRKCSNCGEDHSLFPGQEWGFEG